MNTKKQPFGGKGDHDGDGKPGGSVKANGMVTVRVLRDYWVANEADPDQPERIRKGTIVDVPVEAALDGIESGTLARVK